MQHDVNSDSDSGSSYGCEAMFAMPSPFHVPLNDAEMEMLAASSSSECEECEPNSHQMSSAGAASSHTQPNVPAAHAVQPPSKPGRGKYSREN
eukprot:1457064-Pleurochrysis_carterae.AAC.1